MRKLETERAKGVGVVVAQWDKKRDGGMKHEYEFLCD
jgi:hypothetical protein